MQIKLIPATPHPTILFTVTYSEPPDYLGFPSAWAQALHRLSADDLELPGSVHAFDKTTWLVAVLHSVTFDLGRGWVCCAFVDGKVQGWALDGGERKGEGETRMRCRRELESVLRDVNQSAMEAEREKRKVEAERQAQMMQHQQTQAVTPGPSFSTSPSGSSAVSKNSKDKDNVVDKSKEKETSKESNEKDKEGKHRKQRSLLMSLVACVNLLRRRPRYLHRRRCAPPADPDADTFGRNRSLVSPKHGHGANANASVSVSANVSNANANALSSNTFIAASISTSPSLAAGADDYNCDTEPALSSTALRRRARSTLVNAFRRHVLTRLSASAHPGGYAAWIARNMLERVEGEMVQMVRDAGGAPDCDPNMGMMLGVGGYFGGGGAMIRGGRGGSIGMGMGVGVGSVRSEAGATHGTDSTVCASSFDEGDEDAESESDAGASDARSCASQSESESESESESDSGSSSLDGGSEETEGDRDSASTDTDGSSVHTPDSVSFDGSPFFVSVPPSEGEKTEGAIGSPSPEATPALVPGPDAKTRAGAGAVVQQGQGQQEQRPVSPAKPKLRRQTLFTPRSSSYSSSASFYSSTTAATTASTPSPARLRFTPVALAAYTALSGQRLRLQSVLTRIEARLAFQAQDERQLQSVLEIKSRRRAWSSRAYMGGARVNSAGLGMPARASPLGRYVVCAEDLERERRAQQKETEGMSRTKMLKLKPKRGLVVTTAEHNIMRLFPVCEEDEMEDEEEPAPPYQSLDALMSPTLSLAPPPSLPLNEKNDPDIPLNEKEKVAGLGMPTVRLVEERSLPDGDVVLPILLSNPLQLQRHAVPIRPRTRGILQSSPGAALSSLLSMPSTCATETNVDTGDEKFALRRVLEPQTKVELFDVYQSDEEEEEEDGAGDVSMVMDSLVQGFDEKQYEREEWISVASAKIGPR